MEKKLQKKLYAEKCMPAWASRSVDRHQQWVVYLCKTTKWGLRC